MYSNREYAFDNTGASGSLYEDLFNRYHGTSTSGESFFGHLGHSFSWLFHSIKPRIVHNVSNAAKRMLDITACGFGLLLLSPIFLVIAICIKATDGGPRGTPIAVEHANNFCLPTVPLPSCLTLVTIRI